MTEWLGRSNDSEAYINREQANLMAAMLNQDPEFQMGDELPPAWHWLYFHDIVKTTDLGPDGHPKPGIVMPPLPLTSRMWAGGSFIFYFPLRLGETVQKSTVIRAITPKTGRSGPLYFVKLEHTFKTKKEVNLIEEQTIVYRELASDAVLNKLTPASMDADYSQIYTLNNTDLFRYSALTYNGHRIHYDVDYCREIEGYPNLVVHGPLIVTLLLDLCMKHGRPLQRFSYRAVSTLFLPYPFAVNLKMESDLSAKLWASNHEGALAVEADASFK
jgi:3-methylfumaryl-CoA hydratase